MATLVLVAAIAGSWPTAATSRVPEHLARQLDDVAQIWEDEELHAPGHMFVTDVLEEDLAGG
jgi:hypothetical protein